MKLSIILGIIVILAAVLRLWNISTLPPSLTWDEVAWGYNAYTLGIDGKDEFGKFLPVTYLESFGDFKPPLYAYLTVLSVKIFGLNEFSTRFISALAGVLTVFLTYFLTFEIFKNNPFTNLKSVPKVALLAAFVLAISPWHIMLSRAAFEANVASFLIVLGVLSFLKARENPKYLYVSSLSFVLSMYTFNSARIVAPILVVMLVVVVGRSALQRKLHAVASCILGGVVFVPLFFFLLTPQATLRYQEVNIFSDISLVERSNTMIQNDSNALWSKALHNRRFVYGVEYMKHFFDNLSPLFLFIKGDGNPKFSVQDVGQLYIWEIVFFSAGLLYIFRKKEGVWYIVPLWLLIGIIPAGTARETPHALRIETTLPVFQIITAYGIYALVFKVKKNLSGFPLRRTFVLTICAVILANFIYFWHSYVNQYPYEYSREWQYGYKEAIDYINREGHKYKKVYFTESLGRPYIYALFYSRYDPQKFRREADISREVLGFVHVNSFGKFYFADSFPLNPAENNLYIDTFGKVPKDAKIVKEFKLLDGSNALVAYIL